MLFSAAASGAAALPAPGGGGAMAAGLMEFIDLDSVIVADSGNPIADLASLGHGLMNAALAAMTALMGAAAGSGLLESVPFVGKGLDMFESVWQVADGFVSTVLGLLLIAGAVLAYQPRHSRRRSYGVVLFQGALGGQCLHRGKPPPAGDHGVTPGAIRAGFHRTGNQVLKQPVGVDRSLDLGEGRIIGWRFAHVVG